MTFDLSRIIESKKAYRARLAAMPIEEKLLLLERLQERELVLRKARESMKRPTESGASEN